MPSPLLLNLDLAEPSDLKRLIPRPPIATSEKAGWRNILVQHHRQPASEMPENSVAQHVIVVRWANGLRVNRTMDGKKQQESLVYGDCVIVPADVPHSSSWDQESEFTLLILEATYLAQLAHETINGDRVELVPQFAKVDPIITGIGASLKKELEMDQVGARLYAEAATTFLGAYLLRHYCTRTQSLPHCPEGLPHYKLREAIAYIQEHLGEEISLEAIATHLKMSQYYFCHLFKQSMGISPYQYVLQQRINKAKRLLKQPQMTLTNVALACGFANQTHFTKHFHKLTGVTPKVFREQ